MRVEKKVQKVKNLMKKTSFAFSQEGQKKKE